jgi:SAM-dependent methyltransferase
MFYQSGKPDVERLFKTFERNRVDASGFTTCLEYGCGLGRVTRWLADRFASVTACDISASHLRPAKEYLDRQGITNVSFTLISQVQDIEKLPPVDLIYSVIVLQHNPPPVIELILRQFMKSLNPGGVAYFQLPTYLMGYSFSQENYLSEHGARREMEMHYFPQKKVFEIIRQEGGKLIEVMEDAWTGGRYKEVSNTFLVQKE